jgi:hypothetical protein
VPFTQVVPTMLSCVAASIQLATGSRDVTEKGSSLKFQYHYETCSQVRLRPVGSRTFSWFTGFGLNVQLRRSHKL